MRIGFFVVLNSKVVPVGGFVELGSIVMGVLEVDSIVFF